MKKILLIGLVFALVLALTPFAMAKKSPIFPCNQAPTGLAADVTDPAEVCFTWGDWGWGSIVQPEKYSIDVELMCGEDWDDTEDIQELSFGTSTPVLELCVPVEDFVWDDDGDPGTAPVSYTGPARAKIKALAPHTKGYTQNNCFSGWVEFTIDGGMDIEVE